MLIAAPRAMDEAMPARVKRSMIALTTALVVGFVALGVWCERLYTANVEQTEALRDLRATSSQLRSQVDDQSEGIDRLTKQLAQTNDGGLRRVEQLESQITGLGGELDEIRGTSWLPYTGRDMTELGRDIDELERDVFSLDQCVDSIARVARGSGSYVFC